MIHTTTFSPIHRPWEPQCAALQTDRQTTDGQTTELRQ